MKKKIFTALDLAFFAFALSWFIPSVKSEPSPYGYFPEVVFVFLAMSISRAFAYRNGRGPVLCALEVVLVTSAFLVHQLALNAACRMI